jgi:hypothetical protein
MHTTFACLTFLTLVSAACAQSAPFKMGLWENKITTTNGPTDKDPATLTSRSCVTPESWQKMFNSMAQKQGCTSNMNKIPNGYTFTASCTSARGAMKTNGTLTVQSPEHVVIDSHTVMTLSGKMRQIDLHGEGRFVSSSCGNITPGDPEVD